jgi:hypothetical protein
MGSWSVYCGISQIAITSRNQCVLLPLYKKPYQEYTYKTHMPATLPIFGEYDDYGGLENIEKDANTELIEKHFKVKIEDFCEFFTRGCIRDDEDGFPKQLKKNVELKDWTFMFIDRKVWDFMTVNLNDYNRGHLDFGRPEILKLLGFEFVREDKNPQTNPSYDPKRFNQIWKFGDKEFQSDGHWLQCGKESVHTFNGEYSALSDYIKIPEDRMWLAEKSMPQLWEYLDKNTALGFLTVPLTGTHYHGTVSSFLDDIGEEELEKLFKNLENAKDKKFDLQAALDEIKAKPKPTKKIQEIYFDEYKTFGNTLMKLSILMSNMHCMSGDFKPYTLYLTPQCGEYAYHQVLLDKFAEINKDYVREREEG